MDRCKRYNITISDIELIRRFKKILTYAVIAAMTMTLGISFIIKRVGVMISVPSMDLATSSGVISLAVGSIFLALLSRELVNRGGTKAWGGIVDEVIYGIRIFREKRPLVELYEKRGLRR